MPTPTTTDNSPTELDVLDAIVTAVDDALDKIDHTPGMSDTAQLAAVAVGVARAVAPLLRAERDRMRAEQSA